MLDEYALDPAVLNNWQSFRYFFENFGVSHGRMISRYPKKWKRMVFEACSGCRDIELERIVERLKDIDDRLFRTATNFDTALPWFTNAENNRDAFRAVISTVNPKHHENVLLSDELSESDTLWNVAREKQVKRTAADLASCAGSLLENAKEILFIDPHFDPTKSRYRNTLKAFLEKVPEPKLKRIEYHLSHRLPANFFRDELYEKIPRILNRDTTITFFRWEEAASGDSLHPRYILTDRGGIRIEHGLDEEPGGPTADVSLLDTALFKTRWDDYQKNPAAYFDSTKSKPTFALIDEYVVTGTK